MKKKSGKSFNGRIESMLTLRRATDKKRIKRARVTYKLFKIKNSEKIGGE